MSSSMYAGSCKTREPSLQHDFTNSKQQSMVKSDGLLNGLLRTREGSQKDDRSVNDRGGGEPRQSSTRYGFGWVLQFTCDVGAAHDARHTVKENSKDGGCVDFHTGSVIW